MGDGDGSLGAAITKARTEREVSHAQLADRLHVKPATISMIESGELEPTDDLRTRLKAWMTSDSKPRKTGSRPVGEAREVKKRTTIQR